MAKEPAKRNSVTMTKPCERITSAKPWLKRVEAASLIIPVLGT